MTLSDLAAIGSFVSGLAVLVSLVFLYFQLRQVTAQVVQTEKNQRALMSQGVIDRSVSMNCWISDHSALMVKADTDADKLTDEEVFALSGIVRNILLNFQDYHLQRKMGLADESTYNNALGSVRFFFAMPAFRALYTIRRNSYAPELTVLIDQMIKSLPLQPPASIGMQLRTALTASASGKVETT